MRKILHIDADAFFAAVEQRDDPRLRGKPVAVGSDTPRGVVATASYEARRFGVGSAMPSRMARERCPGLIFVPPRFTVYRQVAHEIRDVFSRYTSLVEPVSIDEAYLDVTEPNQGPRSGTLIAQAIKADIRKEVGLTVSAGVSYCKFLAKLASGVRKPDGLTVIEPSQAEAIIAALPVERIHGVGPRTAERMHALGIRTGADLRKQSCDFLVERFGKAGKHYHLLARGIDDRPVDPASVRKSVSSETTFGEDLTAVEDLMAHVPALCGDVERRLTAHRSAGRGVSVKLKWADHSIETRQLLLPTPVSEARQIEKVASYILSHKFVLRRPVRLLGVGVYELSESGALQPPLFPDWLESLEAWTNGKLELHYGVTATPEGHSPEGVHMANEGTGKPNPTQVQKFLGGVDYPAGKDRLIEHAREENAPDDIIEMLKELPEREFEGPTGVIEELY